LRADSLRRGIPVIPVVAIVPDAASYVQAISTWSVSGPFTAAGTGSVGKGRFPVLIDDGSWRAREDIARFVRAFSPAKVVRWAAPAGGGEQAGTWSPDPEKRKSIIESAAASAWNEKT